MQCKEVRESAYCEHLSEMISRNAYIQAYKAYLLFKFMRFAMSLGLHQFDEFIFF